MRRGREKMRKGGRRERGSVREERREGEKEGERKGGRE